MVGDEVILDSIGSLPGEITTEWTSAWWLVSVLLVPLELLDPSKFFIALRTNTHLGVRASMSAEDPEDFGDYRLSSSAGLSLRYVSNNSLTYYALRSRNLAVLTLWRSKLNCGSSWLRFCNASMFAEVW
jgi:hypothetical protein